MALYAISAVYFAGVMVRLMLTLTPVVCMLSAVAFSSVFEHYLGDDAKRQSPPAEDSSDEDDRKNPGNLYDKVSMFLLCEALWSTTAHFFTDRTLLTQRWLLFSTLLIFVSH